MSIERSLPRMVVCVFLMICVLGGGPFIEVTQAQSESTQPPTASPQEKARKKFFRKKGDSEGGEEGTASSAPTPALPPPPPYTGPKKTIAITEFEGADFLGVTGASLPVLLEEALVKTGRFIVLERTQSLLADVFNEQEMAATGSVKNRKDIVPQEFLGATAIVAGRVINFEENTEGKGIGGRISFFGLRQNEVKGEVGLHLKIVDASTGQVISSVSAEADKVAKANSLSFDFLAGIDTTEFEKSPMADVLKSALNKAIAEIISATDALPFQAMVAQAAGKGSVILNVGAKHNISPGTMLKVYRRSNAVRDPASGLLLEHTETPVGALSVTDVRENASTAKVVEGKLPTVGDIARLN